MKLIRGVLFAVLALLPTTAFAWGPTGHQIVGAIADSQLKPHAKAQVAKLLKMSLKIAGPWADCVKDVKGGPAQGHYVEDAMYKPSCGVFWNPALEAEAVSYADRNWDNCNRDGGQECHTQYHFADVDIDRKAYLMGQHGTNDHDLIHAIQAAIIVLKGGNAPAPFQIASPREALLMLAHLIGDIHQPLHVGSIYLDAQGHAVDADAATSYDPATFTRGGNFLFDGSQKLHGEWDNVGSFPAPTGLKTLKAAAKTVPVTAGPIETWPAAWATDSLTQSRMAFAQLSFAPAAPPTHWNIQFEDRQAYMAALKQTQQTQMEKAGAHMAQLLNAIWP